MSENVWDDRRRALEESFFKDRDRVLLQRLKDQMDTEARRNALSVASGITDEEVLDQLMACNIGGESVAALALLPLVAVAWADGTIATPEREAILKASESEGLDAGSVAHRLLEEWLGAEPPGEALTSAWESYAQIILGQLAEDAKARFRETIVGRARNVATAAGGILGINRISDSEQQVLQRLEAALA